LISIGGGIHPKQIRLAELFTVERVLASRGFEVSQEGDGTDTIIARNIWDRKEADLVFRIFDNPSKRLGLFNCISNGHTFNLDSDIKLLSETPDFSLTQQSFAHTFEWYVGELMIRCFGAFSSSYGVKVAEVQRNSDGGTLGDFDVLSVMGTTEIFYVECKTGKFTGKKIVNMLERARSLHVKTSVMFIASLNENSLKNQISNIQYPGIPVGLKLLKMAVKNENASTVYQWHEAYFVDASVGAVDVAAKLRAVLRLVECKKAELSRYTGVSKSNYESAGYECFEI
jgi:hypothetical protein